MIVDEIIKRLISSGIYKYEAEIARDLEMSPQNFLSRKKSGGIKDSLILLAIHKGLKEDWLLTGQGEKWADKNDASWPIKALIEQMQETIRVQNARIDQLQTNIDKGLDAAFKSDKKIDKLTDALLRCHAEDSLKPLQILGGSAK